MTQPLQAPPAPSQKSQRAEHITLRLADLPDVLTIRQVCAVFQISDRQYRRLREHGAWPIPELPSFSKRFSKAFVQRFIESGGHMRLMRSA